MAGPLTEGLGTCTFVLVALFVVDQPSPGTHLFHFCDSLETHTGLITVE